jgi:hypothetical protein
MVKTQIQLPDELYERVKRLAKRKEWSLAEAFRRGAELLLQQYPHSQPVKEPWSPPKPRRLGCRPLNAAQLRDLARGDEEVPDWLQSNP